MSTNPRRSKVAAIAAIGLSLTLALTACSAGSGAGDAAGVSLVTFRALTSVGCALRTELSKYA